MTNFILSDEQFVTKALAETIANYFDHCLLIDEGSCYFCREDCELYKLVIPAIQPPITELCPIKQKRMIAICEVCESLDFDNKCETCGDYWCELIFDGEKYYHCEVCYDYYVCHNCKEFSYACNNYYNNEERCVLCDECLLDFRQIEQSLGKCPSCYLTNDVGMFGVCESCEFGLYNSTIKNEQQRKEILDKVTKVNWNFAVDWNTYKMDIVPAHLF